MNVFTVWVLVFSSHVYSGHVTSVSGDYHTAADCDRVAAVVRSQQSRPEVRNTHDAQCVEVRKVVAR